MPPVEKLPPLTEEQKRDQWHSAMRKHSEKTDEPFDRRSQGHSERVGVSWPTRPRKRTLPPFLISISLQLFEKEVRTGRTDR